MDEYREKDNFMEKVVEGIFYLLPITRLKRSHERILIIAPPEEAEELIKKLLLDKNSANSVKYTSHKISNETYKLINNVEKVYIGNDVEVKDKLNLIRYCSERNKAVYIVPGLFEISLVNSKITSINDLLTFKVEMMGLTFKQKIIKRFFDIIISVVSLAIFFPLLLIAAITIKLSDGGPVFYKQKRVTKDNRIFDLYKFRTMITEAEKNSGPVFASEKDLRITPCGRFLRASRLDEFPQLINVLKGEMSIVGPRPERPFFVEKFNQEVDAFKYRVLVKAGITGLAQIFGQYATDPRNKVKYDLLYIRNYSLLLDLKIIFNTMKIIFTKDRAKGVTQKKELDEIYKELNLNTYEELGTTKIE